MVPRRRLVGTVANNSGKATEESSHLSEPFEHELSLKIRLIPVSREGLMPELKSETLRIGKLFSQEFFFRVPEYQRPFHWDADHLSDLIDDLLTAKWDTDYFLGTLVVHHRGGGSYDLIDGQQRLTALCILLACIRDLDCISGETQLRTELQDKIVQPAKLLDGVPARSRLDVRDLPAFNGIVSTLGGAKTYSLNGRSTVGQKRYVLARDIFMQQLNDLPADQVIGFAGFISRHVVVIFLAADDFEEAFRLFTVVNDRGKQLRRIDILKASNIEPSVLSDDNARQRYAQDWETWENNLGESNFEELFHLLRLIYVKDKPQQDILSEFQNRVFGHPGMPTRGMRFLDELDRFAQLYQQLFVDRDLLEGRAENPKFRTMMLAMSTHFSASEWKACLLFYAAKFSQDGLYEYLLTIEKVYLSHWVVGMRKDERYALYTDLLKAIDKARTPEDARTAARYDVHDIRDACGAGNFYTMSHCKYMLLRAEISSSELHDPREFTVRSIEHVLPQNPARGSQWRRWFTQQDIDEVVNKAGNLVLLSKGKNASAGNRELEDKKDFYLKPRVSDFPRSMQVLAYPRWTKKEINDRTDAFAELILADP